MTRNEAREIMMQVLYEIEAAKEFKNGTAGETALALVQKKLHGNHKERGEKLITSIIENIDSIDETINSNSTKWKTTRMPKVDLAIMRLALGEIKYSDEVPEAVAINEAINLAKKYSTENSAKFIHGVLGAITKG